MLLEVLELRACCSSLALSSSNNLSDMSLSPLLSTKNVSSTNLNVTCVMQCMWVIHVVTYTSAWKGTRKSSSIYKHLFNLQHNSEMPERVIEQFHIITKCSGKFDCFVEEMLHIRMRKPTLNVQAGCIRAKVFV